MLTLRRRRSSVVGWLAGLAGLAIGSYAAIFAVHWYRFGRTSPPPGSDIDALLDRFMPTYDVVERHHVRVSAPAEIAFESACEIDVQQSFVVRSIFRAREIVLGSEPDEVQRPRGLLPWTLTLGWNVLDEVPGREVVVGSATQPWEPNPVFLSLSPEEFAAFNEPGYVKIAWTLRTDPVGEKRSIVRHETRAFPTDPTARARFRLYWSLAWPGLLIIRLIALNLIKREAEARAARGSELGTEAG
jgi:hypothetical protein